MTLHHIELQNFQKHRRRIIALDPQITVIAGATGRGKSAIINALQWAALNQPVGKDFIRHGANHAKVTLGLDLRQIDRRRSSKSNTYKYNGKLYRAFGTKPPESIVKKLNVGDINFQNQDDPRFWLSLSPAELARELNRLIQLDVIDRSQHFLATEARAVQTRRQVTKERLAEARTNLKSVRHALRMDRHLRKVEGTKAALDQTRSKLAKLGPIVDRAENARRNRDRVSQAALFCAKWAATGAGLARKRRHLARLRKLVGQIGRSQTAAKRPVPSTTDLERVRARYDLFAERARSVRLLAESINDKEWLLCQLNDELTKAETLLTRLAPNQKTRCPKCRHVFLLSSSPTPTSHTHDLHAEPINGTRRKNGCATNSTPW